MDEKEESENGETALPIPPAPAADSNRRRILLVDDDMAIREVTRLMLEHRGFEVVLAKDGVTGLLAYAANPDFAVVISDLRMPRADGKTLITSIRAKAPALPIICMTGVLEGDRDIEAFKREVGINTVLLKPFTVATLMATLDRELASVG